MNAGRDLRRRGGLVGAVLALLLLGTAGAARAADTLTLFDAATRALASHPSVQAARARGQVAAREVGEAESAMRPTVGLSASAVQYQEPLPVTPIHGFDLASIPDFDTTLVQGAVELSYTLLDGGARRAALRQATSQAGAATAGTEGTEQDLVQRTAATYLRVLTLADTLAAHDRRIAALEAERVQVGQRLEVGRAAQVEVRRAEASLAAARAERVRLAAALETAQGDLARLVGADAPAVAPQRLERVTLRQEELPEREELLARALAASPEVARAAERVAAARAAVDLARSTRKPKLDVVGQYLDFGSSQGDFSGEWNAGLRLALPLYTGGAVAERVGRAEAALDAATEDERLARLGVEEALDRALAAAREASARVESLREAVAQFTEVVRIEKLRQEAEVGTQVDYLQAEAELLSSQAGLVAARYDRVAARVALARVTGDLGLDWLERSLEEVAR